MLRGRARFTTAFVEHVAVDHPNDSLDAALASFVARMTGDASDPYTTRRALETLHKDGRSNTITYWNGEDNIKAEDLWVEFVSCALNEVHGFAAHKLEKDALPALVEVGLRGTRPDGNAPPLEPLVLETARVALLGPQHVERLIRRVPGADASSRGKLFELMMPHLGCFGPESESLLDYSMFGTRAVESAVGKGALAAFEGAWRFLPTRFGRVATSEAASKLSFFSWFHRVVVEGDAELPGGFYPGNRARPDYMAVLRRWVWVDDDVDMDGEPVVSPGHWEPTDASQPGNVALAVVQAKFGEDASLDDALASTDLDWLCRDKDGRMVKKYQAEHPGFLQVLAERRVPVIRVVVSANASFGTMSRIVANARPNATVPRDLIMVVSGRERLKEMFGEGWGDLVLRGGRPSFPA